MKSLLHSIMFLVLFNLLQAEEYIPSDIQRIINIREAEVKQIDEQYCETLERLKVRYTKKGELDHALLIDRLIKDAKNDLHADFSGVWEMKGGTVRTFHKNGSISSKDKLDNTRSWHKISENTIGIRQPDGTTNIWIFDPKKNTLSLFEESTFMRRK